MIFGVIHEKDWRQEGQLRSYCSNSFLTELVISKAAKGPHPRDIQKENAVGFIILDIANEGGEESRRTFTFGENMLICFESLHL